MLSDRNRVLARSNRKDMIKTAIVAILFVSLGLVVVNLLIGDPTRMEATEL